MSISREDVYAMGRRADEREIKTECVNIADDIDTVRENAIDPLQTAILSYSVTLARRKGIKQIVEAEKSNLLARVKNAQDAVQESIIDTGYSTSQEVAPIVDTLKGLPELIEKGKIDSALDEVEMLSDGIFYLMLRRVVGCQCPKH